MSHYQKVASLALHVSQWGTMYTTPLSENQCDLLFQGIKIGHHAMTEGINFGWVGSW